MTKGNIEIMAKPDGIFIKYSNEI